MEEIIKKIEQLKSQINIPDIDKYDDNYLYIYDEIEQIEGLCFTLLSANATTQEKHILVCHGTGCTSSKSPKMIASVSK